MGHKQPLSVEYILENRLRMAVLNGMVFALMWYKVLLISFADVLLLLLFQISNNYSHHSVQEPPNGLGLVGEASAFTLSSLTGVEKEIWGWKNESLSANITKHSFKLSC